jgi:hypothetical protein
MCGEVTVERPGEFRRRIALQEIPLAGQLAEDVHACCHG